MVFVPLDAAESVESAGEFLIAMCWSQDSVVSATRGELSVGAISSINIRRSLPIFRCGNAISVW